MKSTYHISEWSTVTSAKSWKSWLKTIVHMCKLMACEFVKTDKTDFFLMYAHCCETLVWGKNVCISSFSEFNFSFLKVFEFSVYLNQTVQMLQQIWIRSWKKNGYAHSSKDFSSNFLRACLRVHLLIFFHWQHGHLKGFILFPVVKLKKKKSLLYCFQIVIKKNRNKTLITSLLGSWF